MMKEQALAYLLEKKSVVPQIDFGGTRNPPFPWKKYQTQLPTEQEVSEWFTKYPEAMIGMVCGKISNRVVVDFDTMKDTEGKRIVDSFGYPMAPERKEFDLKKFPKTFTVRTPNNGIHLHFEYPGQEFKCGYVNQDELVEYKGDGFLVTLPPSVRGNKKYEVIDNSPVAPLPQWFIEKLKERKNIPSVIHTLEEIPNGIRNESAASKAGQLLRGKRTQREFDIAYDDLRNWNIVKCKPPLEESVLRTTFESILRNELSSVPEKKEPPKDEPYRFIPLKTLVQESMAELDNIKPGDCISLGYPWLDDKITGMFPGELMVLGGATGIGKTTFATRIMYKAAIEQNVKCCIIALEDRLLDYGIKAVYFEMGRIMARKQAYNYTWNEYRRNEITDPEYKIIRAEAEKVLNSENIYFVEAKKMMEVELLEKILNEKTAQGFKMFLIDHLHYFDLLKKDKSKADYIEQVMVRIKMCQNNNGARIILVVHYRKLNGKKPDDDSYKDSMAIAQNANYAIHLSRDKGSKNKNETTLFISKARNPNGEANIDLVYDSQTNDYSVKGEVAWKALEDVDNDDPLANF